MSKINDGGPAFPRTLDVDIIRRFPKDPDTGVQEINNFFTVEEEGANPQVGMTLRDWYAGQALAGEMAAYTEEQDSSYKPHDVAARVWNVADAMMAEREKRQ